MIHPHTEIRYINKNVGYGVVATSFIPKGTITWVQDPLDRIYTPSEADALSPLMRSHLETYCFTNAKGLKILCWDHAKYVNHSFMPSCFTTAYDFEIAIRDIYPGEELTDDYGYLNLEEPFEPLDEGVERKVVYPDDLLTYHVEWDEMIRKTIPNLFKSSQPLMPYIPEATWLQVKQLESDASQMISLLNCYYHNAESAPLSE